MTKQRTIVLFAFALMLGGGISSSPPESADTFTVSVTGVRNGTGVVAVALFSEEAAGGFPQAEPLRSTSALASTTGVELTFEDLPAGRYALALMHDENQNGDLDTNDYGIPVEGFAFSNNAMSDMGPPSFSQAAVVVDGATSTSVSMIYMGGS